MTHPFEQDPLPSTLRAAEHELADRLREACAQMQVSEESTGELMRLEDTLLDAARAAKTAVTVRRRMRTRADAAREALAQQPASEATSTSTTTTTTASTSTSDAGHVADAAPIGPSEVAVRNLVDPSGVEWQVWEVTPSRLTRTGAVLSDYREGWLAFESVDGARHRRLPGFPRDWTKLTNLELEHLLGRAEEVKRKPRTRGVARPAGSGEAPAGA